MTDLYVQARILYHLYTLERPPIIQLQSQMDHFEYIDIEKVEKELDLLIQKGYVESTEPEEVSPLINKYQQRLLKLSDNGRKRTESLYTNFVEYIKQNHPYMSHQINIFDTLRSKPAELVRRVYHHIQDEPKLKDAFKEYLENKGSL